MSRAAGLAGVNQSALSQQMTRLESELGTRLLTRQSRGVVPTDAGSAFYREAQRVLRRADQAVLAARQSRLTGSVSVGLTPSTSSVLGLPLLTAMREQHPGVRMHIVESLSGHLSTMLNARQLDLAVLFETHAARRWSVSSLLSEKLFFIQSSDKPLIDELPDRVGLPDLAGVPLVLPTASHSLRAVIQAAFVRSGSAPTIAAEIDSLALLMDAVESGYAATIQPWASMARYPWAAAQFAFAELNAPGSYRHDAVCSLSDDELTPAAHATRAVLTSCAHALVNSGYWIGAQLSNASDTHGSPHVA